MERNELEELRVRVPCAAVLEQAGFTIDLPESSRKAIKYRRGEAIVIVIHAGRGWFDPRSDAKGDVFGLVEHLNGVSFVEGLDRVAALVGFVPRDPAWLRPPRDSRPVRSIFERWSSRRRPWPGSMMWCYLRDDRFLPEAVIRAAIRQDVLREGPYGSMWAAHGDEAGAVIGWEERGREWRGFSTGGAKLLFRFGSPEAARLCVTEAAIDAMSLAAREGTRPDSLYLSTGGGWSPATAAAIRMLAGRTGALLIAAPDNNHQGETYAQRLMVIAREIGCGFERLRPVQVDWNAGLQAATASDQEEKGRREGDRAAAFPPTASRVTLRPAAPALDPPGRRGGCRGGVMKG
ncbi:DUF3991 and toprim domain-containing protein [Bosea spartocytisi]|uniref:DUF3991 and toprim domain-containing protein n=1 Tax=Bosea spartocytisi TaxID=2773451 RepID=UPI0021A9EFFC|nr:DUF3991 and toprim domain-containing protein [Bosea spartocytisi]MCT4475289.1 DUF3991 and toprim domain-containing protein [Bosea spartocytisi]